MIKLQDALITQGLPDHISEEAHVKALAYAINRQIKKVLAYADKARIYSSLEMCSEASLDMIAFELKIPSYKDSLPIETKRRMVQNGYIYWCTMGTVEAVERLCSDIFGNAEITEWFDYGGEPGYFRITVKNALFTPEDTQYFKEAINSVKRLAAWLDKLIFKVDLNANLYVGAAAAQHKKISIMPGMVKDSELEAHKYIGGALSYHKKIVIMPKTVENTSIPGYKYTGFAAHTHKKVCIMPKPFSHKTVHGDRCAAFAAVQHKKITILPKAEIN